MNQTETREVRARVAWLEFGVISLARVDQLTAGPEEIPDITMRPWGGPCQVITDNYNSDSDKIPFNVSTLRFCTSYKTCDETGSSFPFPQQILLLGIVLVSSQVSSSVVFSFYLAIYLGIVLVSSQLS